MPQLTPGDLFHAGIVWEGAGRQREGFKSRQGEHPSTIPESPFLKWTWKTQRSVWVQQPMLAVPPTCKFLAYNSSWVLWLTTFLSSMCSVWGQRIVEEESWLFPSTCLCLEILPLWLKDVCLHMFLQAKSPLTDSANQGHQLVTAGSWSVCEEQTPALTKGELKPWECFNWLLLYL